MRRFVASAGIAIAVTLGLTLASPTTPAPARATADGVAASAADPVQARGLSRARFERKVIKLTNNKRTNRGRSELDFNKKLRTAARKHSNKMANKESVSHQFSGEASTCQRFENAGYDWGFCAENVAGGPAFSTPRLVVEAWWSSDSHKDNMLSRSAKHIGIGVAEDDDGDLYWTMDLGAKR